jgi:hypothetical protein
MHIQRWLVQLKYGTHMLQVYVSRLQASSIIHSSVVVHDAPTPPNVVVVPMLVVTPAVLDNEDEVVICWVWEAEDVSMFVIDEDVTATVVAGDVCEDTVVAPRGVVVG